MNRTMLSMIGVGLAAVVLGAASGFIALSLTRPSDDELQRAILDEFGFDEDLESAPIIGPLLDDLTMKSQERAVEETRTSAIAAIVVGLVVGVLATMMGLYILGPVGRWSPRSLGAAHEAASDPRSESAG